jgi:lipase chaperone LimK
MGSERPRGSGQGLLVLAAALAIAFGARRIVAGANAPAAQPTSARLADAERAREVPRPAPVKPAASAPQAPSLASAVPDSLRGTDEDGALRVDEHGDLIVGPEVLAFFDYHLSATGELSPAAIRARILARIRSQLPAHAAAQATALLDRYLAYREATRLLREDGDSAARLDALHRLRQRIFGADDAARLFGDQERTDAVALAGQVVLKDPSLSPEERAQRLAKLEEGLPEAVRASRARASLPIREQAEEEARKAAGAGSEELRKYRVATVGEAAADRLEALDAQRDTWKQRLHTYQEARAAIAQQTSDPEARRVAEARLLEASFSPEERLRVAALDSIAPAEPPPGN